MRLGRGHIGVATALAVGIAAAVLVAVRPWRSDPAEPRQLARVPVQTDVFDLQLIGDTLVVVEVREINGYSVGDGRHLWRVPERPRKTWAAGRHLVYRTDAETVAVDATTGREVWRQPGAPVALSAAFDWAILAAPDEKDATAVSTVRLATGAVMWQSAVEPVTALAGGPEDPATWLVLWGGGGLRVVEPGGGRVLGRLATAPPEDATLFTAGDLVLVAAAGRVSGYQADGLVPRWTATIPFEVTRVRSVGRLVLQGRDGTALVDPATGSVTPLDLPAGAAVMSPDRAVVSGREALAVVSVPDGGELVRFDGWHALAPPTGPRLLVASGDSAALPDGYAILDAQAGTLRRLGVGAGGICSL